MGAIHISSDGMHDTVHDNLAGSDLYHGVGAWSLDQSTAGKLGLRLLHNLASIQSTLYIGYTEREISVDWHTFFGITNTAPSLQFFGKTHAAAASFSCLARLLDRPESNVVIAVAPGWPSTYYVCTRMTVGAPKSTRSEASHRRFNIEFLVTKSHEWVVY